MTEPRSTPIDLTVPATAAFLRHVRVLTATVADDAGFDVESIESLRLAVDELCALAIADAGDGATLRVEIDADGAGVVLRGTCQPVTADPAIDPIAEQLLRAGATAHSLTRDGDGCSFSLRADAPAITAP